MFLLLSFGLSPGLKLGMSFVKDWANLRIPNLNTVKTVAISFLLAAVDQPNFSHHWIVHEAESNGDEYSCDNVELREYVKYIGVMLNSHMCY